MGQPGGPVQYSPDRRWFWDGASWRPALSPDGRWRWNGYAWVRIGGGLSPTWIALIAGAVIVVLLAATVPAILVLNLAGSTHVASQPSPTPSSLGPRSFTTIPCDGLEHTQVHYHAFVQVLFRGVPISLPEDIGRPGNCYYWLHMHTSESGIIHIESPGNRTFTLGDFFDVWSDQTHVLQQLDSKHVAALTVNSGEELDMYVDLGDGKGASVYKGDPRSIVLTDHEIITLEITPPPVYPPPAFSWPPGF